jgi:Zn-dependent M28 family amino/carboxypeptidase
VLRPPGPAPESHPASADIGPLAAALRADVEALAGSVGPRSYGQPEALAAAGAWTERRLREAGLDPWREPYTLADERAIGQVFFNVVAEVPGATEDLVVVGAHYDTAADTLRWCDAAAGPTPGADDNASGVAALLWLAERFAGAKPFRTLRFVAFTNEEEPWFWGEGMGSVVHARGLARAGVEVHAMLALDALGSWSDAPGSQHYVFPLSLAYPRSGNFLAFVANNRSRDLLIRATARFRATATVPCEVGALPGWLPGVGWSDHWSFWRRGWPALMVTDTALFRTRTYHCASDTPETLDYERLARALIGIEAVIEDLAGAR